jgi:class 3 adenylate cyclase
VPRCSSCSQDNPAGARYCNLCGAPLDHEADESRDERKIVTVLFADLVGFTARAEHLDPEDVREILDTYYARLRSEIERYGGVVEKFIGMPWWRSSARPRRTGTTRSARCGRRSPSGRLSPS